MIKTISNVKVYGLEDSVRASKYPMAVDIEKCTDEITARTLSLAQCEKGTGHDNFLNGIIVQFDLTLSLKAWTEAQRYHFLEFVFVNRKASKDAFHGRCAGLVFLNALGLDFGFFKNRLSGSIDAYIADTRNLLNSVQMIELHHSSQ